MEIVADPIFIASGLSTVVGLIAAYKQGNVLGALYYAGQALKLIGGILERLGAAKKAAPPPANP